MKQKEYIDWVDDIFCDLSGSKQLHSTHNRIYDKEYSFYNFSTIGIPELRDYRNIFYNKLGTKIVPKEINDILVSPLSLAVWLMEDGHFTNRNKATYLCTDSFSYCDHKLLQSAIIDNFCINPNIIKYRNSFRLRFGAKYADNIRNLVKPYFIESMMYKLV